MIWRVWGDVDGMIYYIWWTLWCMWCMRFLHTADRWIWKVRESYWYTGGAYVHLRYCIEDSHTFYPALQHAAAHCHTLQHAATRCNTLQHTAFMVLYVRLTHLLHHTATRCNTVQHAATHFTTLQHTAFTILYRRLTHFLHHTATRCNTLQHTAPHCSTLHHTATYCIHDIVYMTHTLSMSVHLRCFKTRIHIVFIYRWRWRTLFVGHEQKKGPRTKLVFICRWRWRTLFVGHIDTCWWYDIQYDSIFVYVRESYW